jgi:hypothetical protein
MIARISLSGEWDFRLDGEAAWRTIAVPGCWEQIGVRKDLAGPAWYRTTSGIPAEWAGRRIWLRFGGVSYHGEIFVNGQPVGEHTGLWDAFSVEITGAAAPGSTAEIALRVEKPAGLTAGPDSAPLPGRFPLREILAGFLPYVWGHMFGGIWQDAELVATGQTVFQDIRIQGSADGRVLVEATTSAPAEITLELRDPDGRVLTATSAKSAKQRKINQSFASSAPFAVDDSVQFEATISSPRPWSPHTPALYAARLAIADGDERTVHFGLRSLRADGATLLLNEQPIYPRMALSWGWYPEALHSNPGPTRVRADFARLRQLGYNGVKLCLWFPPQYYFDLADELGMLLWVELPMWIPQPSAFFRAQTPIEYERLMRLARSHPSVIIYTLGCELSRVVDAQMLAPLYALAKQHAGDGLVRDNSGSGEAYGGLLNEYADFYDHHFYSDLHYFRGLLDYFAPRGRTPQPWLFGEFCDYDTFRDPRRLQIADCRLQIEEEKTNLQSTIYNLQYPWWMVDDGEVNPQGARWTYEVIAHERRLRANGLWEHGAELERISENQGFWHRKYTLEHVRLYREISGYVVSGEADTPTTTAGMWDHGDRLKFDPAAFRGCNADLVVLLSWDRRRDWVAGGDRAAPWDTWSYPTGTVVRPHLVASHYGLARGPAHVYWNVAFPGEPPFAQGHAETPFALAPGDLRELTVAEFTAPQVAIPRQAVLTTDVVIGAEQAENTWPLWFFPPNVWRNTPGIALYDPIGRLRDFTHIAPGIDEGGNTKAEADPFSSFVFRPSSSIVIATIWRPELRDFVENGGRAILLQAGEGLLPTCTMPFWREATRLAAPHPAWGDFPLDETLAMQMFGCATDHALDMRAFAGDWRPIMRRLDTRTAELHEYALEISMGNGVAIVSTLRFEGGQGAQPLGIARNTAAAYLLWRWATYLQTLERSNLQRSPSSSVATTKPANSRR